MKSDTSVTPELADPVLSVLTLLQHESALVRHAVLQIVQQSGAGLDPDDCLYVYDFGDWYLTERGAAILDRIERHYIATCVALYDNSVRDLDRVRTWNWVDDPPPCYRPHLTPMLVAGIVAASGIITLFVFCALAALVGG